MSHANPYLIGEVASSSRRLPQDVERAAHLAVVSQGFAWMLASNPHLQPDVWRSAWDATAGGELSAAVALACRPLPAPDVEHVVRTDRRAGVLAALTRANRLSGRSLELALAQSAFRNSSKGAGSLLLQDGFPADRVVELRDRLTWKDLLRVLAFGPPGRLDREWAIQRLLSFEYPFAGRRRRNRLVQLACLRDPQLAPLMLEAACSTTDASELFASPVCSTAAAASHLEGLVGRLSAKAAPGSRSFVQMAVAGNPLASEALLREVVEAALLGSKSRSLASSRLSDGSRMPPSLDLSSDARAEPLLSALERSLPGGPYDSPGRPERLLLLARNPNLPGSGRKRLAEEVGAAFGDDAEPAIAEELDVTVPGWVREWTRPREGYLSDRSVSMLLPLGPETSRWRMFFSLLDGWSGNIPDLVEASALL